MKFAKLPTTIEEQIALLRARGMGVEPEDFARRWLSTVGYYRLSAYWLSFETRPDAGRTRSKVFREGTTFEDVAALYVFDRGLRLLLLEALERIEVAVRARWTNRLALAYGAHAHMRPDLFESGWDHARRIAALARSAGQSRETFVEHYRSKYDEPYMPPLWSVTELMTFGELSKWVEATRDKRIQTGVARDVGLPTQETLTGTLQLLSYVRNICAHHGRIWNRRTVKRLPNIKRFRGDLAAEASGDPGQQQLANTVYNVLTVLIRLMRHQAGDTTFPARMRAHVDGVTDAQRAEMGFPEDWRTRPAWR